MAKPNNQSPRVEAFTDHHVITPANPLRRLLHAVAEQDADDPIGRAEQALAGLSGEFRQWMTLECERLAAAHADVLKYGFTGRTRDELFRAAHDIKGDAATFGFPTAGIAAESLCRVIEYAPDLSRVPTGLIATHIQAIQAIVREQSQIAGAGIEHELGRRLRAVADEYLATVNSDRPERLDAILSPRLAPE